MGYHLKKINKGVLGELSKIEEEWEEFEDAKEQGSRIMMMIELSDVFGALQSYKKKYPNESTAKEEIKIYVQCVNLDISPMELYIFSKITERAFKDGTR